MTPEWPNSCRNPDRTVAATADGGTAVRHGPWPIAVLRAIGTAAVVASSVFFTAANWAADRADELEATVQSQLDALSGDSRAARATAAARLLDLGPAILPYLPPLDLIRDPTAREAVRQIREQLERDAARTSVAGALIHLQGRFSLEDICRQISVQSGNSLDLAALPPAVRADVIAADYAGTTFWNCVDDVARRSMPTLQVRSQPQGIALVVGAVPRAVTADGAFRVALPQVEVRPNFIAGPPHRILRVTLELMSEPRLRPLFVRIAENDLDARCGTLPLAPLTPEARRELPWADRALRFPVDFVLGNSSTDPLSLTGRLSVKTAAATTPIRLRSAAGQGPLIRRRGGVTVTLQESQFSVLPDGDRQAIFRVAVAYDSGGPEFESHRTWLYHNDVHLESPDGFPFPLNAGFNVAQQANGGAVVEYRFHQLPAGAETWPLVYVAPTLIVDVPVAFTINGIAWQPPSANEETESTPRPDADTRPGDTAPGE